MRFSRREGLALCELRLHVARWLRNSWFGGAQAVHVDDLLPDVLLFPPGTDLHDHPLVLDGRLILQVGDYAHSSPVSPRLFLPRSHICCCRSFKFGA